jgi:cobaltochelatase CobN
VAVVLEPGGASWIGGLAGEATYEQLIEWARACHSAGHLLPLPGEFDQNRFERFRPEGTA